MARPQPVDWIIDKTSHWPLRDRREHLIQVLEAEKGRNRRQKLARALCQITTRVITQELRGRYR